MNGKATLVKDFGTHQYSEEFTKTDYFCPICGLKNVWEGSSPDYYRGVDYECRTCQGVFENPVEPDQPI